MKLKIIKITRTNACNKALNSLEQFTNYTVLLTMSFKTRSASSFEYKSLYSAVTWKDISQCVQDSVSNVSHFPTVKNRIQR